MEHRIIVKNLYKEFKMGRKVRRRTILFKLASYFSGKQHKEKVGVLRNISFNVKKGEILGIIGRNGCGKSTLLRTISGIYPKNGGFVKMSGKVIPLIGLNVGMQERLSMKDNIFLCCSILGLGIPDIKRRFRDIITFAELEGYEDTKVYQFSSGMKTRLAFSIAIHCNPDVLLLDEVFGVGDEDFRKRSAKKIKEIISRGGSAILVSHSLDLVKKNCKRTLWLEKGEIIAEGETKKIIKEYCKSKSNRKHS